MAIGTKRVSDEARKVLSTGVVEGNLFRITGGQLDRKLYVEVNAALEALGGKWNRKQRGHVFDGNPTDGLEAVIETGEFINAKQALGFFETPDELADDIAEYADYTDGRILEPSAGRGALLRAMARRYGDSVLFPCDAVEIDEQHREALVKLGVGVRIADFLTLTPDDLDGRFNYVVMNPPFARQQDIDHVMHAWGFVDGGGRLVAITSAGWTFRENAKSRQFREFVEAHGFWRKNPEGAFKLSGTGVNTVTVVLEKRL